MSIAIQPSVPLVAAQGATADIVLQPGTVISAQVVQLLGNGQVRISIGGQALDVVSQIPLQPGQTLQLSVSQAADGTVGLAVVGPQGSASASQGLAIANTVSDFVTLAPDAAAGMVAPAAPSKNQLTPQQALAVTAAAQTAATQQAGLAPLFANLSVAATLASLPPQVQQAAALVLAQRTSLDQALTGQDIQRAFAGSGLFLEAALASGSVSASSLASSAAVPDLKAALIVLRQVLATAFDGAAVATAAAPQTPAGQTAAASTPTNAQQQAAGATPVTSVPVQSAATPLQISSQIPSSIVITGGADTLSTASLVLASVTATSGIPPQGDTADILPGVLEFGAASPVIAAAPTPADAAVRAAASSAALNWLQEAVQAVPLTSAGPSAGVDGELLSLLPAVTGVRLANVDDAEFARTLVPPPPIAGALPAAQPVLPAALSINTAAEAALHHLLADTDGAIARQTLLQVASLPGQVDPATGRLDLAAPRWNFEIPFVTPQGTAIAQFEISRDGGGTETEAAKRVWRARFSLDVEPAGPVHAQISLAGERTSVRMWAERPATADQLRAGVAQLSQALSRAELLTGDIVIRDGAPAPTAAAPAGHFLDRAL